MSPQTKIKIRALLSSLLIILAIILIFTGIGLYLAPSGRIARETGWNFYGLDKHSLEDIHTNFGFIFIATVTLHLLLNLSMLKNEVKTVFKK